MTDAPVCSGIQSVFVTITGLQLVGASGTYALTLPQPLQVDLTTLANGKTVALGQVAVPAGTYQQLRLMLAGNTGSGIPANYVVTSSGTQVPLTTPSAQQSGYKINGQITVTANGQSNLTVDFNACRSVVMAGNKYILKPVLNLVDDDQAGAITGYLPASAAGAVVMAEDNQGHILKSTVSVNGPTGSAYSTFTLSPLPASGNGGYNVVIAPPQPTTVPTTSGSIYSSPNFAPDVILNVPVAAGTAPTTLGTSTSPLPVFDTNATDQTYSGTISLSADADTLIVAQETLPNAGSIISVAQVNGVESDSTSTTETYSITVPTAAPYVGIYAPNNTSLSLTQVSSAPTVNIQIYGSDGEYGSTQMTTGTITLTGSTDTNFEIDH